MTLPEWFNVSGEALGWLGLMSLITFFGSLLLVPWLVIKLPEDYFISTGRPVSHLKSRHPFIHYLIIAIKNMTGVLLILAGIAMLVIPGQGLLTILLGLFLMDFSGKYHLERKLIQQKQIRESINWIRLRANKPKIKTLEPEKNN
jgi:hypothetical protein